MPAVFVQEVTAYTAALPATTSLTIPVDNDTATGNTLFLIISGRESSAVPVTITDSRGNAWGASVSDGEPASNTFASICNGYMSDPLQVGDSISVTLSAPSGPALMVWLEEFSGISQTIALDAYGSVAEIADATPTVTASLASVQDDELAITIWSSGDIGNVITQDANYTSFPAAQQSSSGALPGDRSGLAGYRILSTAATESTTVTFTGGITNLVGVLATFKAASAAPDDPVAATYGIPWGADSLANLEVGRYAGRIVGIRWRALRNGSVPSIAVYNKTGVDYSAGTGGRRRCDVMSDDGSSNHFPSGAILATSPSVATANVEQAFTHTFTSPLTTVAGTLYHFVFTNTDATPTANYVSLNSLNNFSGPNQANPLQPGISNLDCAVVWQSSGPPWVRHPDRTPIFTLNYADGSRDGQSYYDALSQSGLRNIKGANEAIRLNFTPTQTLTVGRVWVRLMKLAGETVALACILKTAAGATIDTATIAAASVPVGSSGGIASGSGASWVNGVFGSNRTLTDGTNYRLEVWSTASATGYQAWPIQRGGVGFAATFTASNRFTDGNWEYTTNAGGAWNTHLGSTTFEPQLYFETTAVAPPGGAAPRGRTLRGCGA